MGPNSITFTGPRMTLTIEPPQSGWLVLDEATLALISTLTGGHVELQKRTPAPADGPPAVAVHAIPLTDPPHGD